MEGGVKEIFRPSRPTTIGGGEAKSGTCPAAQMMYCLVQQFQCRADDDCPQRQKCCNSGCGMACYNPIPSCQVLVFSSERLLW